MGPKKSTCFDVRHQANLLLQILLQLNVLLSLAWAKLYAFHILYNLSRLWNFHGISVLVAFAVAVVVEWGRLYAGYSGNLRGKTCDLSIFLILTPLVQVPIVLFLFLSAKSQVLLITIASSTILVAMLFEFLVGVYVCRKIALHQTELYKLKREMALQRISARRMAAL